LQENNRKKTITSPFDCQIYLTTTIRFSIFIVRYLYHEISMNVIPCKIIRKKPSTLCRVHIVVINVRCEPTAIIVHFSAWRT